jgi:hypothetical protein
MELRERRGTRYLDLLEEPRQLVVVPRGRAEAALADEHPLRPVVEHERSLLVDLPLHRHVEFMGRRCRLEGREKGR